jgi:hypothetical protein
MERGRLMVDVQGVLWERYKGGWQWHGPIEGALVDDGLAAELAELLDAWSDRYDAGAEAEAAWLDAKARYL